MGTRTRKAIAGINGTPQSASAALSRPCLADFQTPLVRGAAIPLFLDEASRDAQHQGSYNVLDQKQSVTGIKKHWATKETRERTMVTKSSENNLSSHSHHTEHPSQGTNVMV